MKNKINLAFFVNGNEEIGMGHFYRVVALSKEFLKNRVNVIFITPSTIIKNARESSSLITILSPDYFTKNYNSWIIEKIKENNINAIFFDLLEKELEIHNFLKKLDVFLFSISSFEYTFDRFEDITFFPDSEKLFYEKIKSTVGDVPIYSGPEYLIYRDEFTNVGGYSSDGNVFKIFVSTGAMDTFELIPLVIKAIDSLDFDIECYIAINKLAKTKKEVYNLAKSSSKNIYIMESINNISEYIKKCNVGIINGGMTRYELAILGTPFIAISINKKQYDITERMTRQNVNSINLGIKENINKKDIISILNKLHYNENILKNMSRRLLAKFDTNGKKRIVKRVIKRISEDRV